MDASKLCICEKFRAHRRTNDARRRDDVTKNAIFQHSCQTAGAESPFGLSRQVLPKPDQRKSGHVCWSGFFSDFLLSPMVSFTELWVILTFLAYIGGVM